MHGTATGSERRVGSSLDGHCVHLSKQGERQCLPKRYMYNNNYKKLARVEKNYHKNVWQLLCMI